MITILKAIHRFVLALLVLNLLSWLFSSPCSLNSNLLKWATWLLFTSGIVLFWSYVITKSRVPNYYKLFLAFPILLFILFFTGQSNVMVNLLLPPIESENHIKRFDDITVRHGNQLMDPCCIYEIYRANNFIIEERINSLKLEGKIDPETVKITRTDNQIIVSLNYVHIHDSTLVRDTTLIF